MIYGMRYIYKKFFKYNYKIIGFEYKNEKLLIYVNDMFPRAI